MPLIFSTLHPIPHALAEDTSRFCSNPAAATRSPYLEVHMPPLKFNAAPGSTNNPRSAAGSLALARMAEDRELLDASADVDEAGLTEDEARELLGGGG